MPTAPIVTDSDGKQWYVWDLRAKFSYPFDPDAPVFLLAAPPGGVGVVNAPFLVKGEPGLGAVIDPAIDLTVLEHDDPTADSAEMIELRPGSETEPQLSQLKLTIHKGAPGTDGGVILDPADYGTPIAGRILVVKSTLDGFEYAPQKTGVQLWPFSVTEAGTGTTAGHTLTTISVAANTIPYDWQARVSGVSVVTGSGSDVKVDLVARLNSTTGTVLGRCPGIGGITDRLILPNGPDSGMSAASVTVAANAAATIYFRTEKMAGADTYATGASPSRFCLEIRPA